jgi:phosphoglycerol transferase MdoB-like AlkP superfamily enzyme
LFSELPVFFEPNIFEFAMKLFRSRYAALTGFVIFFLSASFLIRLVLLVLTWNRAELRLTGIALVFAKGLVFDMAVACFFSLPYALYLLVLPDKWNRSLLNRILNLFAFFIAVLICTFSFFAEISFWQEFDSRFNFIAVDYLVYTYEVVNNINESYPLQYLIPAMVLISVIIVFLIHRSGLFSRAFASSTPIRSRLGFTVVLSSICLCAIFFLNNSWAESTGNRYANELSKSGIFSFMAAFRNNELDYYEFYKRNKEQEVFTELRGELKENGSVYTDDPYSIWRTISDKGTASKPNLIMITIESFSADFMSAFGNHQQLTPYLDSLAKKSVLFTDMYATGTRTVRGMEALTLSIPPTPGNSIVRRKNNQHLFTVGSVFDKAGYTNTFFYGGDGYFDNMNNFFGNNGYNITDRGHSLIPGEHFAGTREKIPDSLVSFENAWGICDEDLYDAVIRDADNKYRQQTPFYDFVMTTSNHRPFTYPAGKIDIPPGSGREGAVKYTDYAIGRFIEKIRTRPWFQNTVIIFVADHCASSAGKNEINISRYHIPCIIYNLPGGQAFTIDKQCSQIDLYPTLFGLLHWQYESDFYGKNVLANDFRPRAFVGTYQKLGYMEDSNLVILSPHQQVSGYEWLKQTNEQILKKPAQDMVHRSVSFYQSAYYLYKHGGLHEDNASGLKNRLSKNN